MKEQVFQFGEHRSLIGVACDPGERSLGRNAPAVLFINSGLVHRVGPHRVYVKAARELTSNGFWTMRFDLSGVGDSEPRQDRLPFDERCVIEIQQAMDFLANVSQTQSFVLAGICSGADNAFDVACVDPRVLGIVPIDFYSVSSPGFLFHSYKRRLLSLRSWGNFLTGRSELWGAIRSRLDPASGVPADRSPTSVHGDSDLAPKERIVDKFRGLAERGAHVCLIYSGESPAHYNYELFFREALQTIEFVGSLQVVQYEHADHEFTALSQQEQLIRKISERVGDWAAV